MKTNELQQGMQQILKVLLGTLIVSLGVLILKRSEITTGGTVGLSLSLSYWLGSSFPLTYCLVNIPFYVLSLFKMGWRFTASTLFAVSSLSLMSAAAARLPQFVLPGWFGAIIGGCIMGLGMSYLFLNGSSLGGSNILALMFQKKFGWNPGKVMFVLDGLIIAGSFYSIGLFKSIYSIASIVILSYLISLFKSRFAVPVKAPARTAVLPAAEGFTTTIL
ncbi:YitT family protein [Paenibacillus sp. MMS20-IR301]|uniref:YitT family protein n=1 Tax=Paenibacillus sp. MMS20-IR301 TaxID=2895946 RepID=UPI0028E990D4|nr:YitT family protein [Paenibacillus sp. MMS20-IR301]WNS45353.1 YitT family protein [Paenibacillus sp. MMS20-IR301]